MGEARAEATIKRSADDVWAIVGDFGQLGWMKAVDSCRLEGGDRVISMYGMEITERQFRRDDEGRTLTYGIVAGPLVVEKHEATITVTSDGDASHVVWDVATDDTMVETMHKTYQKALDGLKAKLES